MYDLIATTGKHLLKFAFTFFSTILLQPCLFAQQVREIDRENIFSNPPFASCHASTIVSLPNSDFLCAWFGGSSEGRPDVSIWLSRKQTKWSKPKEVANGKQASGEQLPCWNPVLFRAQDNTIYLFYKVGKNPREWWGEMKKSTDNGLTWSPARKLPDGFTGPIKNKPIQVASGDILYPSSTESIEGNTWKVHMERSDAKMIRWEKLELDCDTFNVIQPSILRHGKDTLQMLCRSRENIITQSWSFDAGRSWTKMRPTLLPNPNSGIDAVTLEDGRQLLVYNPLPAGKQWSEGRSVLKVAVSFDGELWNDILTLEDHSTGEYSYPAVIRSPDGNVHITYTNDRKNITHVVLQIVPLHGH